VTCPGAAKRVDGSLGLRIRGRIGESWLRLFLVRALFFVRIVRAFASGSADNQLPPHEFLVVEDIDGTLCLIDRNHLDKRKAFRLLGSRVGHDFGTLDAADTTEELFELGFRGRVGEVADV